MESDQQRIELRAEVVDVREQQRLDAALRQTREQSRTSQAAGKVAVPGRVERDPAGSLAKDVTARCQTQAHTLQEHLRDVAELVPGQELECSRVGREAVHDQEGNPPEPERLRELHFQEAAAADGFDDALHVAAEARGHAAVQDRDGDAAAGERLAAERLELGPLARARALEILDVLATREPYRTGHDARGLRQAPGRDRSRVRLDQLRGRVPRPSCATDRRHRADASTSFRISVQSNCISPRFEPRRTCDVRPRPPSSPCARQDWQAVPANVALRRAWCRRDG